MSERILDNQLSLQIRKLVLEGLLYKDIMKILDLNENTWDSWVHRNTQGFRDRLMEWKKERIIRKAEIKVEALSESDDERVALDASKFLLETLGKNEYSKRNEVTGADGKPIFVSSEIAEKNGININTENSS